MTSNALTTKPAVVPDVRGDLVDVTVLLDDLVRDVQNAVRVHGPAVVTRDM
jgi:hypothetical protein